MFGPPTRVPSVGVAGCSSVLSQVVGRVRSKQGGAAPLIGGVVTSARVPSADRSWTETASGTGRHQLAQSRVSWADPPGWSR